MRDAFVAGNRDFRLDARRSFNAKFHTTLSNRFQCDHRAPGEWRRATLSIGTIRSLVQRQTLPLLLPLPLLLFSTSPSKREQMKRNRQRKINQGTRKIFCVYGSLTSVPGGKPRTST
jgi:hypothetical protein